MEENSVTNHVPDCKIIFYFCKGENTFYQKCLLHIYSEYGSFMYFCIRWPDRRWKYAENYIHIYIHIILCLCVLVYIYIYIYIMIKDTWFLWIVGEREYLWIGERKRERKREKIYELEIEREREREYQWIGGREREHLWIGEREYLWIGEREYLCRS